MKIDSRNVFQETQLMKVKNFKKICTLLCAVAITFMASSFINSQESYANIIDEFEGICRLCGNKAGTYVWWVDENGKKMTTFFPDDGSGKKEYPGHETFLTDTTKKDSLAPTEDIIIRAGYDESDLLLELEKGIYDYEDEIPPLEVILEPSGYGSDLLLQSNQHIQSTIKNTYTGQVVGTITTKSAGISILSIGNLPAGNYSVLSVSNTGEAASNLFLITPNNEIMLGK